jgi:hypothetical protein
MARRVEFAVTDPAMTIDRERRILKFDSEFAQVDNS